MHIRSVSLRQFRTYNRLELDLAPKPILLVGANAQGKTSLLEAVAYLALGHSPLTSVDQQLIHWQAVKAGMPFAHLRTEVQRQSNPFEIEIALERKTLSNGHARLDKRIRLDQRGIRRADLAGHLNVVLFLPQDVGLIGGPPSDRRRLLDDLLSQVYPAYIDMLAAYQSALSRRNALLRHLRERGGDPLQLVPLEERLVQTGVMLSLYRQRVVLQLSFHADRIHQELTGGAAWLQLVYQPSFDTLKSTDSGYQIGLLDDFSRDPAVDVAALQNAYREQLHQRRRQEIKHGSTLTGPHRDELRFLSHSVDLGIYGSRGQQRTAILALRLAELRWLEHVTGESPVLLLDEVLAELDQARRGYLLDMLGGVEQAILATTDAEMFPAAFKRQADMLHVREGIITASPSTD